MDSDDADRFAAELLAEDARLLFGWKWRIVRNATTSNSIVLASSRSSHEGPLFETQGYRLSIVHNRIEIRAPSATGRFYGVQTLRQLLRSVTGARVPCLSILDYPSLQWRGVSDDISRGQISTVADFKAIVQRLAYYKINLYQPYIEDAFSFRRHPFIGRDRAPLTAPELSEIVQWGNRYHVVVTPIFQTAGHQERILAQPLAQQYAEIDGRPEHAGALNALLRGAIAGAAYVMGRRDDDQSVLTPSTFSLTRPETQAFVSSLVDEIAAAAPGPLFHLGGDEPADIGKGTSRDLVEELGPGRVYARYLRGIARHITAGHGRRAMIYGDMLLAHPDAAHYLPKDLIVVDWHYDPADTLGSLRTLRTYGFKDRLGSGGLWNWFAIHPNFARAFPNIANVANACRREGTLGAITASWEDGGAESLRETNWLGYAYAAACAWQPRTPTGAVEFLRRFVAVEFGATSTELADALHRIGWQEFPTLTYTQRLYHMEPRLRVHSASWIRRMSTLRDDMLASRAMLAKARGVARFNTGELDCVDLAARKYLYAANRELLLEGIARRMGTLPSTALSSAARDSVVRTLANLARESSDLSASFRTRWSDYNRAPMLSQLLARMAKQTTALERLAAEGRSGILRVELAKPSEGKAMTTSESRTIPQPLPLGGGCAGPQRSRRTRRHPLSLAGWSRTLSFSDRRRRFAAPPRAAHPSRLTSASLPAPTETRSMGTPAAPSIHSR